LCASVGLIKKCFDTVDARSKDEDMPFLVIHTDKDVAGDLKRKSLERNISFQ